MTKNNLSFPDFFAVGIITAGSLFYNMFDHFII